MYGGKVNVNAILRSSEMHMVTIRQAIFSIEENPRLKGKIIEIPFNFEQEIENKWFLEYIPPAVDDVDITASNILVSVGRGIKDEENISMIKELAKELKGDLSCSRPIVDKGWLSSSHQVGSSGKTVKPKLYMAIGISGSFQHILGMKNSELIIAINKDPKAPIFNYADYGIIGDLFTIIPKFKTKLTNLKN
jgi:electron transfer flavoprotein alpha subunit